MWPCHRAAACNAALDRLTESGLLEWNGPVVSLSKKGMLLSNEVFRHFV
jgi:hypothetical protein